MALALRHGPGRRPTPPGWGLLGVIYLSIWIAGWFGYQAAVGYETRLRALEDTPWAKTAATIAAGSQGLVPHAVLEASWVRALQAPYTRARDAAQSADRAVTWWLVGFLTLCGAVVAFSVLIPTIKTLLLLMLAGRPRASRESHLHRFVHLLGPWSMAEVFVVAALLVFFGSDGAGNTAAEIEPGTWYFLTYVLMSVTASLLL